ncbi:hypothetical protein LguiB_004271 [Lonicera macranthoides]
MAAKVAIVSVVLFLAVSCVSCNNTQHQEFTRCMSLVRKHLHSPASPQYSSIFFSSQQNRRWINSTTSKPAFIFAPKQEAEIQTAVLCSKTHGLQIRVKSGGHDYEGLSFLAQVPYVIIALDHFRSVAVDINEETAWVQTGATLGELYYNIAQKSLVHAFPGGTCPSVGTGGLISGGGFGMLARKYGLAADNVLDARLVDAKGRILDRDTMGEDLFWAIRGGGGASFGVITAWKLKLVKVPPVVTVLNVQKRLNDSATNLVLKWQHVAPELPRDMLMRLFARRDKIEQGQSTVKVAFTGQFLGPTVDLIQLLKERFPELGVQQKDCKEYSWINATLSISSRAKTTEDLLKRIDVLRTNNKAKSDFVNKAMPEEALLGVWKRLMKEDQRDLYVIMDPFGGVNNEISESELPFPHRKGTLYNIQYLINWNVSNASETHKSIKSMRKLYKYMKPFVTHSPRAAYINYRDLDIGRNQPDGKATYSQARVWGEKYFKGNFARLVQIKSRVDPGNFFRNEQSIPVVSLRT